MHERIAVEEGAIIYGFQGDWLEVIRQKCSESGGEKDLGKVGRILCDYYGLYADLDESAMASSKEETNIEVNKKYHRSVFLYHRMHDARAVEAIKVWDNMESEVRTCSVTCRAASLQSITQLREEGLGCAHNSQSKTMFQLQARSNSKATSKSSVACSSTKTDTSAIVPDLPDHCKKYSASVKQTLMAVEKCQVGRGSTSYSLARGETNAETLERRKKEIEIEQSDEAKEQREIIKKALGSVMG